MGAAVLTALAVAAAVPLSTDSTLIVDSTARRRHGFGYERGGDALQYNRIQGWSLGAGYFVRLGSRFTTVHGTLRYGFSDGRVMGRLSVVRDAPGGRLEVRGYRDLADVDPFALRRSTGNTLNAVVTAHDNGDYYLAEGGGVGYATWLATGLELGLTARVERQRTVRRAAESGVNDFLGGSGRFPGNPPVGEGTYGALGARLEGFGATRWTAAVEGLIGEGRATARAFGTVRLDAGAGAGASLRLKGGAATAPTLEQSKFRLGGVNTVRGFDYGERRGQAFWAAQVDVAPLAGRIRPVFFADAGQAGELSSFLGSRMLVGVGAGISFFDGFIRVDLSQPVVPDRGGGLRVDLVFQAPR